jgi:hypothetical protein
MSSRLRRLARRAKLTHQPEQSDAAAKLHGCEGCRDPSNRQELTKSLIESGDINGAQARCPLCGASWFVSFFADATGQACVRFAVVARAVPS